MQQLFSGQLRFKDENGNDYPDWEEKRLGEICDYKNGGSLPFYEEGDEKKEDNKSQDQKSTSDKNVEGKEDEKNTQNFDSVNQRESETKPQKEDDPNNQNLIQGLQDNKDVKEKKSEG